jgi:hypothetical protein
MKVSKEIAKAHVRNLEQYVKTIRTEPFSNVDEVGLQEWADRKERNMMIPHQREIIGPSLPPLGKKTAEAASQQCQWRGMGRHHFW